MYQRGLRIALRTLAETLSSLNFTTCQHHAFLQRGQDMALLVLQLFVVDRLAINLDETIKLDNLALGNKLFVATADGDVDGGLLNLGISHLAGDGTFPNELVELALLDCSLYLRTLHIGRTDSFVSLLSTLRTGVILAYLAVFLAIELNNLFLAGIDTES